ncbi:signal recognition particle-docking protein FtsY [Cumulibacter manganitolerans]|uniref:signal recognition particle-docking protein FtsY n=1 Tax=Cumulibacter manganitolerans TaxID=1884992 RepID=UPI001E2A1FE5|nr:signal recognition particle-docking protein FtsY [Cumulibacter manganitolerans]
MEWLYISLALLVVIIGGGYAYIVSKGRKVMRLEDRPARGARAEGSTAGGAERPGAGTATLDRPGPAPAGPTATRPAPSERTPLETPRTTGPARSDADLEPTDSDIEAELESIIIPNDAAALAPPADTAPAEVISEPQVEVEPQPEVEPAPAAVPLDTPPSTKGRMGRLRERLARSNSAFGRGLLAVLAKDEMEEEDWEDLEDSLLRADVGVAASTHIVEQLRTKSMAVGAASSEKVKALLADEMVDALDEGMDRSLAATRADGTPAVVMVVGVNGTGKTTTCGKLARVLVGDGHTVLMGAADTFRAAAADQLSTWGERVGVDVVRGPEKADPASVAFDAVKEGKARGVDTVLIDTAGRLHTKQGLMDELGKVKRVVEKHGPVDETLLVLDATTGQNGLVQARVFTDVVNVTGVVLTKLDGSAKGGIVIAVQKELGVPVKFVGMGEGKDDLIPFVPREFVDGLLQTT